ncbi:MAG: molybdopterin molybdotransferase MoeA, partial [Alphaproteobacteria bacterium]|nr:molybdopterin molybdotransferase MoeA [Alphaproteobacteria bacterium]
ALGAKLTVTGESAAGHPWNGAVGQGQAARIFTGAYVPAGADSIVIQEDVAVDGATITINDAAQKSRHIRPAGQDFRIGDIVLRAPKRLSFRDVGLIAAANVPWLSAHRRPRVAILSTGDEVVMPGDPVGPGQLASANGPGLAAFITAHGGEPIHLGIARDDAASLAALARAATGVDLLVTSGGVSVGDHDLVSRVLGDIGLAVTFHKIAMRPGKPLMFGHLGATPFLGLPGNPVSAMVGAVLFLGPALDRLSGLSGAGPLTQTARLGSGLKANDKREDYLRASLTRSHDGALTATAFPKQDSAMIRALAEADGLIVRPPHAPEAKAGDAVPVILLNREI